MFQENFTKIGILYAGFGSQATVCHPWHRVHLPVFGLDVNEITLYVSVCYLLSLLNIMFLRFLHVTQ